MLTLPEAIDIWPKNGGFNAKQIVKALDVREFLMRAEKDRLISRKLLGSKSYNGPIIDGAFLTVESVQ